MLGLLVKDIRLMLGQKMFFLTIALVSVYFVAIGQDPTFVVSYSTFICIFFTISTMSYDEFNHGLSFLFTLPVSRKSYVLEKYLFGLGIGGLVWLVATVVGGCCSYVMSEQFIMIEWVIGAISILFALSGLLCVMLPIQFKFGSEKGRTAMFVFMAIVFGVVMALTKIDGLMDTLEGGMKRLASMGTLACSAVAVICLAAIAAVSICVSIRVIERKEY